MTNKLKLAALPLAGLLLGAAPASHAAPASRAPLSVINVPAQSPAIVQIPFVGDIVQSHPIGHPDSLAQPVNEITVPSPVPPTPEPALPQLPIVPVQPPVIIRIPLIGDLVLPHPVEHPDWPSLPVTEPRAPTVEKMKKSLAAVQETLQPQEKDEKPAPETLQAVFDGSKTAEAPAEAVDARAPEEQQPKPERTPRPRKAKRRREPPPVFAPEWELERDLGLLPGGRPAEDD